MSENNQTANIEPFTTFRQFQSAHEYLIKRRKEDGVSEKLLLDVQNFILRGLTTGEYLYSHSERLAAQSTLDYWYGMLLREGITPPESTLLPFEPDLAPEINPEDCPYLGLFEFDEGDERFFFGRETEVQKLVSLVKNQSLLSIVGPSGSGKSSLVLAGLLPALKTGAIAGSADWFYLPRFVPGSLPFENLSEVILDNLETETPEVTRETLVKNWAERFSSNEQLLSRYLSQQLDQTMVIIIDQFEELFTLCQNKGMRVAFLNTILNLVNDPHGQFKVILTLRSDFEPWIIDYPGFADPFHESRYVVPALSEKELREAIIRPANRVGLIFADGIVDGLIEDLRGEHAALPLLQYSLLKLWDNRERNRVPYNIYEQIGGGRLALTKSADEFYNEHIPEEQETIKRLFLFLVKRGEGLEVTRRRVNRNELKKIGVNQERLNNVLTDLEEARLIKISNKNTKDEQIEVAHEALLRNWPMLVNWLNTELGTQQIISRNLFIGVIALLFLMFFTVSMVLFANFRRNQAELALEKEESRQLEIGFANIQDKFATKETELVNAFAVNLSQANQLTTMEAQRNADATRDEYALATRDASLATLEAVYQEILITVTANPIVANQVQNDLENVQIALTPTVTPTAPPTPENPEATALAQAAAQNIQATATALASDWRLIYSSRRLLNDNVESQSGDNENVEIVTSRFDGTDLTLLTETTNRAEFQPDLSPDGRKIVFLERTRNEEYDFQYALAILDGNGVRRRITAYSNQFGQFPKWSPDGRYIAYEFPDVNNNRIKQIYLYDINTGNARKITRGNQDSRHPAWFADGESLAISTIGEEGSLGIYEIDLRGNTLGVLIDTKDQETHPAVSKSGKIAYTFYSDPGAEGNRDIYTYDPAGDDGPLRLTSHSGLDWYPVWGPEEETVYFESQRYTGISTIWAVDADGSDVRQVTIPISADTNPAVGQFASPPGGN